MEIPSSDELIHEYGPLVSSICRRMVQDPDAARDASQEVWLQVLKSLPTFRGESKLSTWLFTIARRTVRKWEEAERKHSFREFAVGCRETVEPSTNDPERLDAWVRALCDLCLTALLHCLEPDVRFLFLLRTVASLDYRETARIMDMRESAVRQACSRAARKLARFATSECVLLNPEGACRCGQKQWVQGSQLAAEYSRLRSMLKRMQIFLDAETAFPGRNHWEPFLVRPGRPVRTG